MAERKVLVKYYPPDFNPERLIRNQKQTDKQSNVRMMLPFSLKCYTCGHYLYIGTKFNMRMETCEEEYLGIPMYRFYMKCTYCYSEITFKTDPKNHDYVCEQGGSRNYEAWRDAREAEHTLIEKREEEEKGNAMTFLENRTKDSKREMDILDALDEIRNMSRQNAKVTPEQMFDFLSKRDTSKLSEQEENEVVEQFKQKRMLQVTKIPEAPIENQPDSGLVAQSELEQAVETKQNNDNNAWKLHTKITLKKKTKEAENSSKSKTESEDEEKKISEYQFPPKPSVLCDYSEEENDTDDAN